MPRGVGVQVPPSALDVCDIICKMRLEKENNPILGLPEIVINKPVDWNEIKECVYSVPKKMTEAFSLLKDVALNDFDTLDFQRYYFYMGKFYQYDGCDGDGSFMYSKSYLYASSSGISTLEAKKAAINLANILYQRLGFKAEYSVSLFDNRHDIMIAENLDIETLLNFASKDRTYPRALFILARHKYRKYADTICDITKEESLKLLGEIYSLVGEYNTLINEKSNLDVIDSIDINQAKELSEDLSFLEKDIKRMNNKEEE